MLTSKLYEAVGRLTILFNEIDEILNEYLPLIPQFGRLDLPKGLGNEPTFNARANTFRRVLELASEADAIAAIHVSAILPLLDRSLQLAAKRNEFVHAVAFMDFANNERLLKTRKGVVPPDEKLLIDLGSEAAFTARKIAVECEELLRYYLGPTENPEALAPEW